MAVERVAWCPLCKTKHAGRDSVAVHARLWTPEMGRFGVTGKGKAVAQAVVSAKTVAVAEKTVEKTVTPEKAVTGCPGCGKALGWFGKGRRPKYCGESCRAKVRRAGA